ncbi:type II toxin-antitoxin system HipA family toxin [Pantoea phytobeneficialis]|uniref:Phosphatidylinositol kinase n=1 Tax=Pantoea phytobeneficialis TaxID=2052056 RepID=A0AAP9KRI3_9GAMM|nr:type II toxin-antitoxin system HipA family toxin [Pantoea phytobeneficialis]MDO6407114.1 type II toxin-antitoxin system HipA family toxin [Pantoea phytobeneficialis]QGR09089.1 phosphatidylinositol kinase [Pantoea phytobeneficialis]
MMTDLSQLSRPIRQIEVYNGGEYSGRLLHEHGSYNFTYASPASRRVSLTMLPDNRMGYNASRLFNIFEMNIPEGYVRYHIAERLRRYVGSISDMLFLALQQDTGIGALSCVSDINLPRPTPEKLEDLLRWDHKESAFQYLLNKYLLQTTISGVQPKVMISSESRGTVLYPNLIAKTGDEEYPRLAENEFICMSLARACGLPVADFWLSDNKELFIMERFDIQGEKRLAMEDFCVLAGKTADHKYTGSYETGARIVSLFTRDQAQVELYWRYVLFSCMVGNGDAHLKNFSLVYQAEGAAMPQLSPLYDVVNTQIYPTNDNELALKLNKSKQFPDRDNLIKFGRELKIIHPERVLEEFADVISTQLTHCADFPELQAAIGRSLTRSGATNNLFMNTDVKRPKKRKTDVLLK